MVNRAAVIQPTNKISGRFRMRLVPPLIWVVLMIMKQRECEKQTIRVEVGSSGPRSESNCQCEALKISRLRRITQTSRLQKYVTPICVCANVCDCPAFVNNQLALAP